MPIRITGGLMRGRNVPSPETSKTRPTASRTREALFNILQGVENFRVLDLFAGTGSISLECASRGAQDVTAVELAHTQQNFIISASKQLGAKNLTVVRGDVFKFVPSCRTKFDLIFADPPYQLDKLPTLPDLIFSHEMLAEGGWFVLEHSANNSFQEHPHFVEERKYGNVHFSFFQ